MADRIWWNVVDPVLVVTGSRDLVDPEPLRLVLKHFAAQRVTLFHGAQRGADTLADGIARSFGWEVIAFPYPDELDEQGVPVRNAEMLCAAIRRARADGRRLQCFAFPRRTSRGTKNCVALAHCLRVPTIDFPQDVRLDRSAPEVLRLRSATKGAE